MTRTFEGIRILTINSRSFNRGAAMTIPGIGIVVGKEQAGNTGLLRHEFGHVLQCRQKGIFFFWLRIAPVSLWSSFKTRINRNHVHMHTWTEWSANLLSYHYFNQPGAWDFDTYPIRPHH